MPLTFPQKGLKILKKYHLIKKCRFFWKKDAQLDFHKVTQILLKSNISSKPDCRHRSNTHTHTWHLTSWVMRLYQAKLKPSKRATASDAPWSNIKCILHSTWYTTWKVHPTFYIIWCKIFFSLSKIPTSTGHQPPTCTHRWAIKAIRWV